MNPFRGLPTQRYDIIYADPPWNYKGSNLDLGFPLVSDVDMERLPIFNLLARRGILFVWTTGPRLNLTIKLIERHWGLNYRGVAFVWVKTRKSDGAIIGGHGVRPSIVKPTTEFVLVASKVKNGRPLPLHDETIHQVVTAPRRELCRKPDEVRDRIEYMYPKASKLELFSREFHIGWKSWGNETGKFILMDGMRRHKNRTV